MYKKGVLSVDNSLGNGNVCRTACPTNKCN